MFVIITGTGIHNVMYTPVQCAVIWEDYQVQVVIGKVLPGRGVRLKLYHVCTCIDQIHVILYQNNAHVVKEPQYQSAYCLLPQYQSINGRASSCAWQCLLSA